MESALHQDACAAECDRFVDLLTDLIEGTHVRVGCAGTSIERAESADDVTNVGVVDVAIDDVSDDVVWMAARAYLIRCGAHARDVVRFEEEGAFSDRHALARKHAIEYWLNVRHDQFVSVSFTPLREILSPSQTNLRGFTV